MRFTAVGDALIQQRIPEDYKGFSELKPYIMQGDARFFNLETTLCREGECFASQFSGGTYLRANPEVLDDLQKFGFNITTFNNNHAMDFSYGGLISTLECLKKSGLIHAGVGLDLDEAGAPRYLKTENGTVALISVNFSFEPSMMAGSKSKIYPGRPGVNGIRIERTVQLTASGIEYIRNLENRINLNAGVKLDRESGYLPPLPEDRAELGELRFAKGDCDRKTEIPCAEDIKRVEDAIKAADANADYIIVSMHTHQVDSMHLEYPTEFSVSFAHRCIDLGANAVVGHGPHLLRPIEVYKDSPIFYSLGDFILELYSVSSAPEDFYQKYGLTSESSIYELLKKRSKNFTIGLMEDNRMLESVIPYWETENKKLKALKLLPVSIIGDRNSPYCGLPTVAKDSSFMKNFAKISEPYGVIIKPDGDGCYRCEW